MSQGKAWDKEKVIEALMPYLKLDYSVKKSCEIIGLSQSTVQTWIDNDEELRLKIDAWRAEPSVLARKNWLEALVDGKPTKFGPDKYTPAKEWLERRDKEFSVKSEVDHKNDGGKFEAVDPSPALAAATKAFEDVMKKEILK